MAISSTTTSRRRSCQICGSPLSRKQLKTCSRECQAELFRRMYRGSGRSPYTMIRVDGRRVYLHRHIWETHNGRQLDDGEIVHHKDENKRNNDPANLEALSGRAAHLHCHNYHRRVSEGVCTIDEDLGW
jgi:hypothetical protein